MLPKEKAIAKLQRQLDLIKEIRTKQRFSQEYQKWQRDTQVLIQNIFGEETRHIADFNNISYSLGFWVSGMPDSANDEAFQDGLDQAESVLKSMIDEINDYWLDSPVTVDNNQLYAIEKICNRFHRVARQIQKRHENRGTLMITDEYDVQDLFHALLSLEFDDIRAEEWTPSYAGSSSRMDFLLKKEHIVVEVKKTRNGLGIKEVGEQLIIDIKRYQAHPDCSTLVCFIYDPESRISNPCGLENDLSHTHEKLDVKVIVSPKGF